MNYDLFTNDMCELAEQTLRKFSLYMPSKGIRYTRDFLILAHAQKLHDELINNNSIFKTISERYNINSKSVINCIKYQLSKASNMKAALEKELNETFENFYSLSCTNILYLIFLCFEQNLKCAEQQNSHGGSTIF